MSGLDYNVFEEEQVHEVCQKPIPTQLPLSHSLYC